MRWASASLLFIIVMSMCFMMFIVFNWVLYNDDNGVVTELDKFAEQNFNRYYNQWFDRINNNIALAFGIAGIVCMFVAIICYIAEVFSKQQVIQ